MPNVGRHLAGNYGRNERRYSNVGPYKCFKAFVVLAAAFVEFPIYACAADKQTPSEVAREKIAVPLLEYGATTANALYRAAKSDAKLRIPGDRYQTIANSVAAEIEIGKAASALTRAPFKLASDVLIVTAVADPEPTTKVVAAVAAYGARKFGEAAGQALYDTAEEHALAILARGLTESKVTVAELNRMTPDQFAARVEDLRVGGQKMRDILKDAPAALEMLKANAADFAQETGAATLLQLKQNTADTQAIKQQLVFDSNQIRDFRKETTKALGAVENGLSDLAKKADQAAKDLESLKTEVGANTRSLQSLAQVSSMSWSTSQKLAALNSGLFPEMTARELAATRKSLQSQLAVENAVNKLQMASQYLDSIGTIAGNLGVDPKFVKAVRQGQTAVTGITKMVAGDYLGGIAALTGLFGIAGPDAAEQRHQQLMAYLEKNFEQINKRLEEIVDLQKKTIEALVAVSQQLVDIKDQLSNVERVVVINRAQLQTLLLEKWQPCDAMIGALNNQFSLTSLDDYVTQLKAGYFVDCYKQYVEFFDARVKAPDWAGGVLSYVVFPFKQIAETPEQESYYAKVAKRKVEAYAAARRFLLSDLKDARAAPARYLVALAEPQPDVESARGRDERIASAKSKLDSFTCDQTLIHASLRTLICQGLPTGTKSKPREDSWSNVLNDSLVGPQAIRIIDAGIVLSSMADFLYREQGAYKTVPETDLISVGSSAVFSKTMLTAQREKRAETLLERLHWLSEAYVLQQSVAYGDVTTANVADVLYDSDKRALRTEAAPGNEVQALALLAMKTNPVLARNVVMIGMRRALMTTVKSGDRNVELPATTIYALGVSNYSGASACVDDPIAKDRLTKALPNWNFSFRAEKSQRVSGQPLERCKESDPDLDIGGGLVVVFKDFEVKAPTPRAIYAGELEYPASLRIALAYRQKIAEAQALRGVRALATSSPGVTKPQMARGLLASGCLSGVCAK